MEEGFRVEIYPAKRGLMRRKQWRARVVSEDNGNNLFGSSESYNNRAVLVELCQRVFPDLRIVHVSA